MTLINIPLGTPLIPEIARRVLDLQDPLIVSSLVVLMPSQRLGRALEGELIKQQPSLILPRIVSLTFEGDYEDFNLEAWESILEPALMEGDLPPVPPFVRVTLMSQLILKWQSERGHSSPAQALKLGRFLGRFLDRCHLYNIGAENLESLVPQEFSTHWGITLEFLRIFFSHWPQILKEAGYQDPCLYLKKVLEARMNYWKKSPPQTPYWGLIPPNPDPMITALLHGIESLPHGILFSSTVEENLYKEDTLSPTHPFYGMENFLKTLQPIEL